MKKSLLIISSIVLSIILFCTTVLGATYNKNELTMELVKDEKAHVYFGEENFGEFTKEKTDFSAEKKTIDITLTAKNNAEPAEETATAADVVFLIDNSNSMHDSKLKSNGESYTRSSLTNEAAKELSRKLLNDSQYDVKIGIIEFATAGGPDNGTDYTQYFYDPAGNPAQNDYSKDALVLTDDFTNESTTIDTALARLDTDWVGGSDPKFSATTNIAAGLKQAQEFFADHGRTDSVKNLIILTDGVPEFMNGNPNNNSPMSSYTEYEQRLADPTKQVLSELVSDSVVISNILIDFESELIPYEPIIQGYEPTKKEVAHYIFGTKDIPNYGSNYYVTDEDLTETVTNNIYSKLISQIDGKTHTLKDIVIEDVFPQKIIDNFDFSIVKEPTKGTISNSIHPSKKSIVWTIPELAAGETATVTYRLSLKEKVDSTAVSIDLPTNEKVTIEHKDEDNNPGDPVETTKTPVVKLTPPAPVNNTVNNTPANIPVNKTDNTQANKTIPQTGTKASTTIVSIALVTCLSLLGVVSFTEYKNTIIK